MASGRPDWTMRLEIIAPSQLKDTLGRVASLASGALAVRPVLEVSDGWDAIDSPINNSLNGIDLLDATLGFAVGIDGKIIKWDGASWITDTSNTTKYLHEVSVQSSSLAFACGVDGTIMKWDGTTWAVDTSGTTEHLLGIRIYNTTNAFAVGEDGTLLKWDGTNWSADSSGTTKDLYSVDYLSTSLAFAVGQTGTILKWDGTTWSADTSPTTSTLREVRIFDATLAFAVGEDGVIIKWNGTTWASDTSPVYGPLYGLSIVSTSFAVATGAIGVHLKWDGTTWTLEPSLTDVALRAVDMISTSVGYLVGTGGIIIERIAEGYYPVKGTADKSMNVSLRDTGVDPYLERLTAMGSGADYTFVFSTVPTGYNRRVTRICGNNDAIAFHMTAYVFRGGSRYYFFDTDAQFKSDGYASEHCDILLDPGDRIQIIIECTGTQVLEAFCFGEDVPI